MYNPYFIGFPMVSLIKYVEILLNDGYIIVIVDQIKQKTNQKIQINANEKLKHFGNQFDKKNVRKIIK